MSSPDSFHPYGETTVESPSEEDISETSNLYMAKRTVDRLTEKFEGLLDKDAIDHIKASQRAFNALIHVYDQS